jgi:type I restriction enzyme R subunit
MIATGTDVKPLECLLFMRDVRSAGYFEQMKGRGCRIVSSDDRQGVMSDVRHQTRLVIVDAVGVCERQKADRRMVIRTAVWSDDRRHSRSTPCCVHARHPSIGVTTDSVRRVRKTRR